MSSSYLKQRLEIFRHRPFMWYTLSSLLAMFGNGLTYVSMSWALVELGEGVGSIAILMTCFWAPTVIIGPIFGVYVDRFQRRTIILISNMARLVMLLGFWYFSDICYNAMAIYLLALGIGAMLALYTPAAMALVREVVSEEELLIANSTVDIAYELGAVAGMGAAGFIISLTSIPHTFLINALFYVAANACIYLMHHKTPDHNAHNTLWKDLVDGTLYVFRNKALLMIYLIQMMVFISYMTAPILLAPFARNVLKASVGQFGIIEAAASVGLIFGSFITPYLAQRFEFLRVLLIELILLAGSFYAFSYNSNIIWSYVWYFMIGLGFSVWPLLVTEAQDETDLAFQGRVQAFFNSFSGIGILLIYAFMLFLGDQYSLKYLYFSEVVIVLLGAVLLYIFEKTHRQRLIH